MGRFRNLAFVLILAGCTSTPTDIRYYLLTSSLANVTKQDGLAGTVKIAIGPVIVADYLDQPLLVTVNDGGSLNLSENDRWASPLNHGIQSLLISRLADKFSGARVAAFPASPGFMHNYRVAVEILRLDGRPGELVTLHARFRVIDSASAMDLHGQEVQLETPFVGAQISDLVAAENVAILAVADAIASYFESRAPGPE
ncbi:MAG: putative lipoprotein YmbA [Gammaproteobacteria bacterium]|jgi:uncharacterized lipoprotein YmbA